MYFIYLFTILFSLQAFGSDLSTSQTLVDVSNLESDLLEVKMNALSAKMKHTEHKIRYDFKVRQHNQKMISDKAFNDALNHFKVSEYQYHIERLQALIAVNEIKISYGDLVKKNNVRTKDGSRSSLHLENIKLQLEKAGVMLKLAELNKKIYSVRVENLKLLTKKGYATPDEYTQNINLLSLQKQKIKLLKPQVDFLKKTLSKSNLVHQKILKSGK